MEQVKKVAIIGHFGGKEIFLDGQTIKSKILYDELKKQSNWKILIVDTYYKNKNPFKLLWDTVKCLCVTKDIFILLSSKGRKLYFPLLTFCSRVFGTRVYHDVIGGMISSFVDRYPKYRTYLNAFRVNWVETDAMKRDLEARGVTNAQVVPNFKRLNVVPEQELRQTLGEPVRFCTFSRVMKDKGIEDAINAVENINAKAGKDVCVLDIYGKVDDGYIERFETVMKNATPAIRYCGLVPYDQSVETIKVYDALLFPTYWVGEGFAGTIVDAFSAGLPVLATDWNRNGEIVNHMQDGILYPCNEIPDLETAIYWVLEHPEQVVAMKKACVLSAEKYQPDAYIKEMIAFVESQ